MNYIQETRGKVSSEDGLLGKDIIAIINGVYLPSCLSCDVNGFHILLSDVLRAKINLMKKHRWVRT